MDLSHLTPEQVAQLRALLLPEPPVPASSSSSTVDIQAAPSSSFSSLLPPPPSQASASAPVPHQHSVRFMEPLPVAGSLPTQTAAATMPPPITQLYQSNQHSGHPSSGHPNTSSSFQPFLGISSLGAGFAAGHANQARLASAATTLPRQPTLSRRTSRSTRTRGPAIQPPSIPVELAPGSALHLRSCFVSGTSDPVVRLTVKVYPPAVSFY